MILLVKSQFLHLQNNIFSVCRDLFVFHYLRWEVVVHLVVISGILVQYHCINFLFIFVILLWYFFVHNIVHVEHEFVHLYVSLNVILVSNTIPISDEVSVVIRRVSHVEQELQALPQRLLLPPFFFLKLCVLLELKFSVFCFVHRC